MKLWKRATASLKDQNSIVLANLSRRTPDRNPDLESAVIKATSHEQNYVDYRNAQRVFAWLRTSPVSLKPLIWAVTTRMEKTRSWVVAIKGLMLLHGVFCCKIPAVQKIGRLPFDLSNFSDGHSRPSRMWGFNSFIRAYYAFLDQRCSLLNEISKQTEGTMVQELLRLQNWQALLDLLLQIKPLANNMKEILILEALDCVIIEIFDVYSRICNGIAKILAGICKAGKLEAIMALKVLQRATTQGEDLALYFEFCRHFGVFNAMEVPKVTRVPEEDIRDLERIISGVSVTNFEEKAIVEHTKDLRRKELKTIITDKWEVFDEDHPKVNCQRGVQDQRFHSRGSSYAENSFESPSSYLPLVPVTIRRQDNYVVPDLISF